MVYGFVVYVLLVAICVQAELTVANPFGVYLTRVVFLKPIAEVFVLMGKGMFRRVS